MQLRGLDNVLFGHCSELYALSAKQTFLSEGKTNVISTSSLWGATHDPKNQPQTESYRCAAYWPYEGRMVLNSFTDYRGYFKLEASSTQPKTSIQGQHLGFMIWDFYVYFIRCHSWSSKPTSETKLYTRMLIIEQMKPECSDIKFTDYRTRTGAQFRVYDLRSLNIFCEVQFMFLKTNHWDRIVYTFADFSTYEARVVQKNFTDYRMLTGAIFRVYGLRSLCLLWGVIHDPENQQPSRQNCTFADYWTYEARMVHN